MAKDILNRNHLSKEHEEVLSKVLDGTYKDTIFNNLSDKLVDCPLFNKLMCVVSIVVSLLYVICIVYEMIYFSNSLYIYGLPSYMWLIISVAFLFFFVNEAIIFYKKATNK